MARKKYVLDYRPFRSGGRFFNDPVKHGLQLTAHSKNNSFRCSPYTAPFENCFVCNLVNVAIRAADAVTFIRGDQFN